MPHENTEVIKGQMAETRQSLANKIETLETKVVETVQNATDAVSGTVESVKEVVGSTVGTVKSAVDTTVASVGQTVQDVKESFDVPLQVERHPWLMFGGAVATGFLLERLCETEVAERIFSGKIVERDGNGHSNGHEEFLNRPRFESRASYQGREDSEERVSQRREAEESSGILPGISGFLGKHLGKVQGLALGALFGVLRNVVARAMGPEVAGVVSDVVDDMTRDLGGKVMPREEPRHEREPVAT